MNNLGTVVSAVASLLSELSAKERLHVLECVKAAAEALEPLEKNNGIEEEESTS